MQHCHACLGPPDGWLRAGGYPGSLALRVIDSIQSTGPHYTSVVNVVGRYRAHRGARADEDGTDALLAGVLLTAAAEALEVSASDLDHAAWRHRSGRPWRV